MKFTPGALRSAARNLFVRNAPSGTMSSMQCVLMFYKGTMPTQSEIETKTALRNSRDIQTVNGYDLLNPRASDYMGALGWRYGVMATLINDPLGETLEIQMVGNDPTVAGLDTNPLATRTTRIPVAGVPTWFAFVGVDAGTTTLSLATDAHPMAGNPQSVSHLIVGSVGDENSTADLKLIGGQIYRNVDGDYSRTPQLHNLRVKIK